MAKRKHYRKQRVSRRRRHITLLNPRRRRHHRRVVHALVNPRRRKSSGSLSSFKGVIGNMKESIPAIAGGVGGFIGNKLSVKYLGVYLPAGMVQNYVPRIVAFIAVPWLLAKVSRKAAMGAAIGSGIELANYALTNFGVYTSLGLSGLDYQGSFQGLSYNPNANFGAVTFKPVHATPLSPFGSSSSDDRFEKRY